MDIEYLREFLVLAQGKSYLEAADILYISQSSLSKHIKRLESDLGELLFKRTTRKVVLSEYGELLLPYAKEIVRNWDEFHASFDQTRQQVRKNLTIGSTSLMAVYGITDVLTRFRRKNPTVKYNLIEGGMAELKQLLLEDRCDFAFIRQDNWSADEQFDGIPFAEDIMAAILPKDHPLAGADSVTMEQLKNENFMLMQGQELIYELCQKVFRISGITPNIVFVGSNSSTIVGMVGEERGVSLLMKKPAMLTCSLNSNVVLVDIAPCVQSDIVLIFRKNKKMSQVGQLFIKNLEQWKNSFDE